MCDPTSTVTTLLDAAGIDVGDDLDAIVATYIGQREAADLLYTVGDLADVAPLLAFSLARYAPGAPA
jgi:hypothetical protein